VAGNLRGYEEHAQSIVVSVLKAAGDAAVEFDESVDRFGAAVAGAGGVEVENGADKAEVQASGLVRWIIVHAQKQGTLVSTSRRNPRRRHHQMAAQGDHSASASLPRHRSHDCASLR
jgi:hypothetical protein